MLKWLPLVFCGLLFFATAASAEELHPSAQTAWQGLPQSQNGCEDIFDYFPNGGLRNFWCHVQTPSTLRELATAFGSTLFVSGPHRGDTLDFANVTDFGHYNPTFVSWFAKVAIPANPAIVSFTKATYDAQVRPLARIMWGVRKKLLSDPACASRELDFYKRSIVMAQPLEIDRWYNFMDPRFCSGELDEISDGGWDGNVTKSAVGFWLRRTIDGTAPQFDAALGNLMTTYDTAAANFPQP